MVCKNVPGWERVVRGLMGVMMITGGLMMWPGVWMGYAAAAAGAGAGAPSSSSPDSWLSSERPLRGRRDDGFFKFLTLTTNLHMKWWEVW